MSTFCPPEKCPTCPVQKMLGDRYITATRKEALFQAIGQQVMQEGDEGLAMALESMLPGSNLSANTEQLGFSARTTIAQALESFELEQKVIKKESELMGNLCDGTLRLRATKNSRTFLVEICTSALATNYAGGTPTAANITIT